MDGVSPWGFEKMSGVCVLGQGMKGWCCGTVDGEVVLVSVVCHCVYEGGCWFDRAVPMDIPPCPVTST